MPPKKKTTKKPAKPAAKSKKPAAKSKMVRRRTSPESPAVLEGIDRSGSHSAARELSWAQFDRVVQQLSRDLMRTFRPDAVVGVAHGGVFVGGALASALKVEFYPVRISRRSRDQGVSAAPKLTGVMPKGLKGRRVVIVDDIAASGDTLELATELAKGVGATRVATAALISRPKGFEPDFCWERTSDFFVFPWDYDLSTDQRFRALM
jgi:hypoxanthine phosphoribosyltransferase